MTERPKLSDVWNWLPTFRAVAETEHLPSAAKRLHVTPAAISRTLGLLEDRLGRQLFNRTGKRLVLNGQGRTLLASVADAMNDVEQGLEAIEEDPLRGPVRITTVGVLTNHYVLPAVLTLQKAHPELAPILRIAGTREAAQALLRGDIDVAFIYEAMTLEGIHVDHLGQSPSSVYCGSGHPLFGRDDVDIDELLDFPFSVPQVGDTGQVVDGWPSDVERQVGMRIQLLTSNVEICRQGQFLTVLPDVTAMEYVTQDQLWPLNTEIVPAAQLYAVRRSTSDGQRRARGIIEAVRQQVEENTNQIMAFRAEVGSCGDSGGD